MSADAIAQQAALAAEATTLRQSPTGRAATYAQARKAGREFEAMFVTQMFQHMFSGLKTDGWFGGGEGEEMFRPMLIEQYGKMVANHGNGIGIGEAVARVLLHAQENQG